MSIHDIEQIMVVEANSKTNAVYMYCVSLNQVDQPSHWAQQKQPFDLPSASSIEDLKTPAFEELLKSYQGTRVIKINGDVNRSSVLSGAAQSLHHKFSLSTIN